MLFRFVKAQPVCAAALTLALLSACAVPPDGAYLAYPDWQTLALLFCLMAVVAGLRSLGVFLLLGDALLGRARTVRALSLTMVLLCFFSSMVITNDVALITFVPFTLLVFRRIGRGHETLRLAVLETIAANLGSMATPIGNPQNLFLCSMARLPFDAFAWAVLPYAGLGLALLSAAACLAPPAPIAGRLSAGVAAGRPLFPAVLPFAGLLAACLFVVFRVLPWEPVLAATLVVLFLADRKLFRGVDYFLLVTFLCFFVFVGNVRRLPELSAWLASLMEGRALWAGLLASQCISNVPAAVLLSGFTRDWGPLLTGVNIGGLGTPVASLASLITLQFYSAVYPYKKGPFLAAFSLWNAGFLAVLSLLAAVLS